MIELRPFQRRFLARAFDPGTDTACLSLPRGNGKSTLAAYILARCLTPGDPLHEPGREYVLTAASLPQSRFVFRPLRAVLEPRGGYRFIDSITRVGILHKESGTRLTVVSSKAKSAMGLVRTPLVVIDEPGSYDTANGEQMSDALFSAQGKPDSPLRLLFIGTLSPARDGWWHDLVNDGSHDSTFVMKYAGDPEKWDRWPTIQRSNPLMARFPESRRKLLEERDAARADSRLKSRFLSYRLNVPSENESKVLLTIPEWAKVLERECPERNGEAPVVGLDLGHSRAWSAAVAMYPGGRTEAVAVAPGVPSIEVQERRDRVPRHTYQRLVDSGVLRISHGREVVAPRELVDVLIEKWGQPYVCVSDRLKVPQLRSDFADVGLPVDLVIRRGLWSESNEDIFSLRRLAKNGPLAVAESSRNLLTASLAASMVKPDAHGNLAMVKRGSDNCGRDDVAAAFVLAAGEYQRRPTGYVGWRFGGVTG